MDQFKTWVKLKDFTVKIKNPKTKINLDKKLED
jgi:hypothetical protein